MDVALRAASTLKNRDFQICLIVSGWQNSLIWSVLSLRSMLERLVLKKYVECTSQRLKWTSGARVMTIFGRSVARSLARSLGRSVARSLARSLGCSVARSLAQSLRYRILCPSGRRGSFVTSFCITRFAILSYNTSCPSSV